MELDRTYHVMNFEHVFDDNRDNRMTMSNCRIDVDRMRADRKNPSHTSMKEVAGSIDAADLLEHGTNRLNCSNGPMLSSVFSLELRRNEPEDSSSRLKRDRR